MARNLNHQFKAVMGAPVRSISVGALAFLLETTDHDMTVASKYVGPLYSTTVYDETDKVFYRVHHTIGLKGLFKHLAIFNPRIRNLETSETYKKGKK